jgi:hypothetical protein
MPVLAVLAAGAAWWGLSIDGDPEPHRVVQERRAPASGGMTLQPVDGGRRYFERWTGRARAGRRYFPIGVWLEAVDSPGAVAIDKGAGLNTYVGLTANSTLSTIRVSGMKVLLQQDEWRSRASSVGRETMGWGLLDEIDMSAENPRAGRAALRSVVRQLPDDGRLRYNNFGKGVAFWLDDADAAGYVNGVDVASADVYWFTDGNVCGQGEGGAEPGVVTRNGCHVAANYGWTVKRLRALVRPKGSKPVWAFVEVGHPFTEAAWPAITPAQVRAAVWHSLIAGARGVIYFNHSFGGPCLTQHALREACYSAIRSTVTATNRRISRLAAVLNAPFVTSGWSHGRSTRAMVKWSGGHFYLFAASAAAATTTASFTLRCVGDATAKVLGERRSIRVTAGAFRDRFANADSVHIYRIDGGRTCKLRARARGAR